MIAAVVALLSRSQARTMNVLVLNCGSSSAKFAVIDPTTSQQSVAGIAQDAPR